MTRKTKTIERNLTATSQVIAEELVKRTGSIKTVLSAGVIALSKLTADQREKMIIEANTDPEIIEQPETAEQLLDKLKEHFENLTMEPGGKKILYTPAEISKIFANFRQHLPLPEKPKHKTKNEVG